MAETDSGRLFFTIELDNKQLQADAQKTNSIIINIGDKAIAEGARIDTALKQITSKINPIFIIQQAQQFITQVARVRGEFQQLEITFETLLQSKSKADALMSQITRTATTTPFNLQEIAQGAKQLLSYGETSETVNDTLLRLGNIATGLSIPLNDLASLYGATSAQGQLLTQDVKQFQDQGIPLVQELSKELGKTTEEINDMVSAGQIGFPQVQKVIQNMTSEGGMFFNLMEKQNNTITGQISNLGDAWDTMLNKFGQSNEGIINGALSGVTSLVENYEEVGQVILELVATYGAYKAVLITITALQGLNSMVLKQAVLEKKLAAMAGIQLSNAEAIAEAKTKLLTIAQQGLAKSFKALTAAMLSNPYVLVAAAVATLAYGIYKLATAATAAEKAQKRLNDAAKESQSASIGEIQELSRLKGELSETTKGTKEYNTIKEKIVKGYGQYYKGLEDEIEKVGLVDETYQKLTESIQASFDARQYDKFKQSEQESLDNVLSENLGKIQDRLIKELGDEAGAKYYSAIRNSLLQGKELSNEVISVLDEVQDKGTISADSKIDSYISNIRKAQQIADDMDKKARIKFGINNDNSTSDNSEDTIIKNETKNKSYWEKKKKESEDARDALDVSEKNSKEWKKYSQEIADAQKEIDKYSNSKKDYNHDVVEVAERTKKIDEYTKTVSKQVKDSELEIHQVQIEAMENGYEKEKAQINLNYDKLIEQNKRRRDEMVKDLSEKERLEWENKNPDFKDKGLVFTPTVTSDNLSKAQLDVLGQFANLATQYKIKAESDLSKGLIDEYGNYQQKRALLAETWERKIAETPAEYQEEARAKMYRELAGLDNEYNHTTTSIEALFKNMSNKSVSQLRKIANEAKEMRDFIKDGVWNEETGNKFHITESQFNALNEEWKKSPELLEKVDKGIVDVTKNADNSENAFKKLSNGLKKVFNAGSDKQTVKEGLKEIQDGLGQINDLTQSVGGNIASVFSAFGNDDAAEMASNITNLIGGVGQAGVGVAKLASGDIIGGIKDTVAGVTQAITSIVKIGDSAKEKEIQVLQKKYDAIDREISVIEGELSELKELESKSYGSDKADVIAQESKSLEEENKKREQQIGIIQQQISKENDKKDTDKGKVNELSKEIEAERKQIAENRKQIEQNKELQIDALFGSDIHSAIENFAQAYADAWGSGTEKAKNMKKVVRDLMRSYVMEMIKADKGLAETIAKIRSKIDEYLKDGIIDATEQKYLDEIIGDETKNLDNTYGGLMGIFNDESSREATQKGFASMSQDSADELNGRFTALQTLAFGINENTKILVANSGQILLHLAGIESNTRYCENLTEINSNIRSVKSGIDDMNVKGIFIKK